MEEQGCGLNPMFGAINLDMKLRLTSDVCCRFVLSSSLEQCLDSASSEANGCLGESFITVCSCFLLAKSSKLNFQIAGFSFFLPVLTVALVCWHDKLYRQQLFIVDSVNNFPKIKSWELLSLLDQRSFFEGGSKTDLWQYSYHCDCLTF